ncbi:MAG: small multi-drug export protein [Chloroflexi bacterium]|jgi:uncharacterized membrane protein|nr:small multi-drug export protein [Chloroflexota bacterium]MBT7079936.1 small multi-drug export protein [Chloroflexota bacterium]MBT7290228.1 small multi-drug export protein [Chloroflexota bacterium]
MVDYLKIALITLVPWIELRASIPIGILDNDLNPVTVFAIAVIVNILLFFPIYFGLKFAHKYLIRWKFYERTTIRIREKGEPYIKKYGFIGLGIFIGIPLPGSGVYSGTLLAWLVGMDWKKAFAAAVIGVLIAGSIVFLLAWGLSIALGDFVTWRVTGAVFGFVALFVLWRWRISKKKKRALASKEPQENG